MPIFGDGEQTRAFSYVGDVIPDIADAPFTSGARLETSTSVPTSRTVSTI